MVGISTQDPVEQLEFAAREPRSKRTSRWPRRRLADRGSGPSPLAPDYGDADVDRPRVPVGLSAEPPAAWLGLLAAVGVVAFGTLLIYPLKSVAPVVSLGVVYIPGILLVATIWALRLGLMTALLSALAFNWFHIPPVGHLSVADSRDLVALVVFVIVAATSSTLAGLARARATEAERRREDTAKALTELEILAAERDRMEAEAIEAEAFRRSDELKTALLRSVSHDLRTPLTSMIAAGAAVGSPSASLAERQDLSAAVVDEGRRLSRLVENLLDASRLESGKAEPHREFADVGEVLETARRSLGQTQERVRPGGRLRASAYQRRRRATRTGIRERTGERGSTRRGQARAGAFATDRAARRRASRRSGTWHPRDRTPAHLRTLQHRWLKRVGRYRARPRDCQGLHRGQPR